MWIRRSITVGTDDVSVDVRRLSPDVRARTAAQLAWFASQALAGLRSNEPGDIQEFMQSIFDHVRYEVPDRVADDLSDEWWTEASHRAMTEFIKVNELTALLTRYLDALDRVACSSMAPRH